MPGLVRRMKISVAFAALCVLLAGQAASWSQTPEGKADPDINKPFRNPDPGEYVKKFETESREVYKNREAVAACVGLKPGMSVADIGAGTGLFTRLFAAKVGPEGAVYAVDIAPTFLKHIEAEATKQGLKNIRTVLATQDSNNLPEASVDVAFLCDVYHHLEKPDASLAGIHRALKPGGRLVVVEFDRVEGKSSDFVLKHIRASKDVFTKEIQAAGFALAPTPDAPALKENFILSFRRLDKPATSTSKSEP